MATFTFINPSGSSYFTMETIRNSSSFYEGSSLKCASGSFDGFSSSKADHINQSNYIFAQVIPPGTSSFNFNNAITIPVSNVYFRGTGAYNLIVTV
jgi:hypothetical protein